MVHRREISDRTVEALKNTVFDAVVAIDAAGDIISWNAIAVQMFGWTVQEAVGRSLADLIVPPQHRASHRSGMQRYARSGIASVVGRRIEISAIDRAGREFPVELSIILAPEGGAASFVGFIRDISERHAAQTRLMLSEESLRLATEAAEIGTWDLDLLTDELTWSDRTKAMFGISPDVSCSMVDFYEGLHPDDREATAQAFASALDPVGRATYDVQYRTIGKEDQRVRWVAAKGKGLFDTSGRCTRAVGTAIEITERKLAEGRNAVMLEMTELLRGGDTAASLKEVCALMGRHFGVARVGFGDLDTNAEVFSYSVCWTNGEVPPLLGEFPASAFGVKIVDGLSSGRTVVVEDLFEDPINNEPRTQQTASEVDTRSILVVPFLRAGRLGTILYLNDRKPRRWTADDVAFMESVAERTRQLIERTEAEAALAASEAEFRTFAQAMPNHVWAATHDGMLNWFNEQTYLYSGAKPGELDGTAWETIVHPDDRMEAGQRWRKALATGETYEAEFRIRRTDGIYRWHIARALPIRSSNNGPSRWIGTNTDIEDQKVAVAALANLNANLEEQVALRTADRDRVWRNSQDLLVIVDESGTFRDVSPSVTRLLGWQPEEMVGRHLAHFVLPEDSRSTESALRKAIVGALRDYENRYRHKDGGFRWLSWVAAPEEGTVYAAGRDITVERAAAEELARTQDALRQSQKMEAVGQLTGGIAHDFNNMLAVVLGSLDLLKRRLGGEDARNSRYLDAAVDGARRAALLTQRLLAFSRQQPLRPEPADLNRVVTGMADLLRGSLGTDIRLETVLGGGLWQTHVDVNQFENVILNLVVNGRDAMPEGGRLTVETQNAYLDDRYAANEPGLSAGQYVLLAVTDTGSGMPAEVIAKAFDPFFTTKGIGKGTGLGLSQVYGFIKQSGGHVRIYSEQGLGTTVKIYLPRMMTDRKDTAIAADAADFPQGDFHEVVLVVEDEPAVRQFSCDALMELGYRVLEADGAASALAILDGRTDIQLLFTDIVMPDTNGRRLADEAVKRQPGLKVLFTTGYTRNAVVHNGILDPGVALIGKPFTIEELAAKVREVLDS